ncbi:MAG TPA: FAD-dependent oxidoreductase, partial [Actinomycetota bacterium]|nr:FAD-dependent oxidoreductase [Actinomycetota bacterium]
MAQGVVVVAVADRQAGGVVTDELERRYGGDYRVVRSYSASAAVGVLEKLAEERESVAVLLADKAAAEEENNLLLATCRERHPTAKRGLLVGAADPAATPIILRLMAVGLIDTFVPIPQRSPDEQFHRAISEFLEEWASGHLPAPDVVTIVGERWNQRSYELRDLLGRAGVPYTFHDARSAEGREVLTAHGMAGGTAPVVVIGGQAVANPSTEQLADALGASVDVASETHDVTVVGAGPAGLSAAVYAASEGLRTLVIEEGAFGGQAASSSLIRNYLGFPHGVSGAELARRAYGQAVIFGAAFHFGRRAVDLYPDNQVLRLGLSDGSSLWTR